MDNRTKMALCFAGALFCIGGAGVLVHSFSGAWKDEAPTAVAGPALSLMTSPQESAPSHQTAERYAYITGAVQNPGVYPIAEDSRVFHLVEAAGGFRYDADTAQINMAAPLRDGAHINVKTAELPSKASAKKSTGASNPSKKTKSGGEAQYVNVNTATEEELCQLPGVGPVLAKKIVEHRQTHGSFESSEALLDVSGIGRSKLDKMRSLLRF